MDPVGERSAHHMATGTDVNAPRKGAGTAQAAAALRQASSPTVRQQREFWLLAPADLCTEIAAAVNHRCASSVSMPCMPAQPAQHAGQGRIVGEAET